VFFLQMLSRQSMAPGVEKDGRRDEGVPGGQKTDGGRRNTNFVGMMTDA
jgi:hypothetical protein